MSYDPELWRLPRDRIWALKEAAKPSGMMPNAEGTAKFLKAMELEGLVRQSETAPVWYITDAGHAELAALTHEIPASGYASEREARADWNTIAPAHRTQERLAKMLAAVR